MNIALCPSACARVGGISSRSSTVDSLRARALPSGNARRGGSKRTTMKIMSSDTAISTRAISPACPSDLEGRPIRVPRAVTAATVAAAGASTGRVFGHQPSTVKVTTTVVAMGTTVFQPASVQVSTAVSMARTNTVVQAALTAPAGRPRCGFRSIFRSVISRVPPCAVQPADGSGSMR